MNAVQFFPNRLLIQRYYVVRCLYIFSFALILEKELRSVIHHWFNITREKLKSKLIMWNTETLPDCAHDPEKIIQSACKLVRSMLCIAFKPADIYVCLGRNFEILPGLQLSDILECVFSDFKHMKRDDEDVSAAMQRRFVDDRAPAIQQLVHDKAPANCSICKASFSYPYLGDLYAKGATSKVIVMFMPCFHEAHNTCLNKHDDGILESLMDSKKNKKIECAIPCPLCTEPITGIKKIYTCCSINYIFQRSKIVRRENPKHKIKRLRSRNNKAMAC